jgi:hypothetical protein
MRLLPLPALFCCTVLPGVGCGSSEGSAAPQSSDYACRVGAIILSGFQGSCDTRSAGSAIGQCREFWGIDNADAPNACAALGGAFDASAECPKQNRILRCSAGGARLHTYYSYYAPSYTEAKAAAECTALGGACLLGPG